MKGGKIRNGSAALIGIGEGRGKDEIETMKEVGASIGKGEGRGKEIIYETETIEGVGVETEPDMIAERG